MAIRVLHLIGSLRLGGAQVVVKQIVENASGSVEHFVYPLRCRQIDIPIKGHILSNSYPNYDPRKFFDILKICKKHNIDIIHAHLHKPILGALLATYFQKIPVIVHEHGPIFRPGIQYTAYRFLLRCFQKRLSVVIANSRATAYELTRKARIPESKIRIIHNAVGLDTFRPNPEARKSVRRDYSFCDDDIVIGFIGRLHKVKGVDLLVNAIPLLLRVNPNFKLVLVGEGPLRKSLEQQVRNDGTASHVRFTGFQENVAEIMTAFDLGCVPSRQDAFGMAALEMMSMKVPLVSSDVEGLAELVQDRKTALALKNNTPKEIAAKILELAADDNLKGQLQENASSFCQQFGIPHFANQINDIYREIGHADRATNQDED